MDAPVALIRLLERLEGRFNILSPGQEPSISLGPVGGAGPELFRHSEGSELSRKQVLEPLAVFGLFPGIGSDKEISQAGVEGKESLTRLFLRSLQLRLGQIDSGRVYKNFLIRQQETVQ